MYALHFRSGRVNAAAGVLLSVLRLARQVSREQHCTHLLVTLHAASTERAPPAGTFKLGGGGSSEGGLGGLLGTITRSIGTLSTKGTAPKKGPKDPRTVSDITLQQQPLKVTAGVLYKLLRAAAAREYFLGSTVEAVQQAALQQYTRLAMQLQAGSTTSSLLDGCTGQYQTVALCSRYQSTAHQGAAVVMGPSLQMLSNWLLLLHVCLQVFLAGATGRLGARVLR
jgi:hypothetical protein